MNPESTGATSMNLCLPYQKSQEILFGLESGYPVNIFTTFLQSHILHNDSRNVDGVRTGPWAGVIHW